MTYNAEFIALSSRQYIEANHRWADNEHLAEMARVGHIVTYPIPAALAQETCKQICHEVAGHVLDRRMWACLRCLFIRRNGLPAGLVASEPGHCSCVHVARRLGYAPSA